MPTNTEEQLTKDIYKAMQSPWLSECHDAIKSLIKDQVTKARLDERNMIALDNYRGQTFSDATNWQGKFEKFVTNNQKRITQLVGGELNG